MQRFSKEIPKKVATFDIVCLDISMQNLSLLEQTLIIHSLEKFIFQVLMYSNYWKPIIDTVKISSFQTGNKKEMGMEYKHRQLGEFVQRQDIQRGLKLDFF